MGVHWKIRLLRVGGGSRKTNIDGGDCLKRGGAWAVCWFKERGLGKKEEGGVFKGGLKPQCLYKKQTYFSTYLYI